MKIKGIKETCIYSTNLASILDFYNRVLELPVIGQVADKHVFFHAGSSVLLFFNPEDSKGKKSPPGHYGGGKQHFAFEVPAAEYQEAKDFILKKGVQITDEVTWPGGMNSFYFEDPDGNVLEIVPDTGIWN